jgi:hypothetical protein
MALDLATGELHYLSSPAGLHIEQASADSPIVIARDDNDHLLRAERR